MLTRRQFIRQSGGALAATAFLPPFLARLTDLVREGRGRTGPHGDDTVLVVVQMSGGNDGLNTVVPYGLDGYPEARPTLGIESGTVLPLSDTIGLHPAMAELHERYRAGEVAIIQGVGYENPSLSHFRSMDVWHTADPDNSRTSGWLANYLASAGVADSNPIYAASVTGGLSPALYGEGVTVPAIAGLEAYRFRTDRRYPDDREQRLALASMVYSLDYTARPLEAHVARTAVSAIASSERVQVATAGYSSPVDYPRFPLAGSLKTVAQLMAGDLGTRIYYVAFGGFDTHSAQPDQHARLLAGFASSVDAFFQDVAQMGKEEQVLLMTFSEFGRRVNENGSQGTDHGTAGPMFLIGPRVKGGLYGEHPSLKDLDRNGNLKFGVDFRAVYGTALEGWLGVDQEAALDARYENLGFV